ncbi:putative DNA-directed RNA polymerase II chain Rpb7 [Gonapodya prolifera JEL478]|uniref:Putative DNA-directed RNA polymerase II chain Rpb7 n=1 Tax=Gonapodya prolifera (strain JEL478) TaxID=1344416 RepID=A0A139AA51_GONPJ|nr:putative DNA-directed RNA polymerase II chain Rpb7 [Gonapodya prolifera JEL478]|eukprot:KXS13666.1 putative DNA-directed RNA polymerase II chain Rpb7 [Gonapodya prolifera JEL478]
MFFVKSLSHTILLPPKAFGKSLREQLIQRLRDDKEGTCDGRFGYIVHILEINDPPKGLVQAGTGFAEYRLDYRALVFKPFRNEVMDGVITNVMKTGFFAECGPLQVFVSTHLMPPEMKLETTNGNTSYVYPDDHPEAQSNWRIVKNENVRLKIVSVKPDMGGLFAIGSIRQDHLGRIAD